MILTLASAIYGAAANRRRHWYARHPSRVRRLSRPVISVGNLSVGGSGKTPVVASLARLLLARGERPAILSRGYARRGGASIVVVSDGTRVRAGVDEAGDEPFMLATALPGVRVVVGSNRHDAGRIAETELGSTVHVLDDGFQHLGLARDVDLVIVHDSDVRDRVLPAGRLRESADAAKRADAILIDATGGGDVRRAFPATPIFTFTRAPGAVRVIEGAGAPPRSAPVLLMAGIARPERFDGDLRAAGWTIAGTRWFRDHHWYSAEDREAVAAAAKAAGAAAVLTTEKDAVRLGGPLGHGLTVAAVPLVVEIESAFTAWLIERLPGLQSSIPNLQSPISDLRP